MDIETIKIRSVPILKKHGVTKASVFGSATRNALKNSSDIDFLVQLPNDVHGFDYVALKVDLQSELADSLNRDIDLIEFNLVKPELEKYILPHQIQIL